MVEFGGLDGEASAPFRPADHGFDTGRGPGWEALPVGERYLALAAEPIAIFPELGLERAGRLAVERLLSGVAVSGVHPAHLVIDLNLPPEFSDAKFETLWTAIDAVAADHGVSIAGGHTGRYDGCTLPMAGAGMALGFGEPADVRSPAAVRSGDKVLATTGAGAASAAVLAACAADSTRDVPPATAVAVSDRFDDRDPVAVARSVAGVAGVRAIGHAADGGLLGAFTRLADGAGAALSVERDSVPIDPAVSAVLTDAGVDPWRAMSAGTLVMAVAADREAAVRDAAAAEDSSLATAGRVVDGSGILVDGDRVTTPGNDHFWTAYAERRAAL